MAETSLPWGGRISEGAPGDAGPYTDDTWSDVWRKYFLRDRAEEGVLDGYANELAVTGVASPISVASGAGIVDGKFYENSAALSVVVAAPAVATRIDRVVLRKDFVAQTVRITLVAGVEGGGAPALTQVDGTTWDIPLAQLSITIGGVITVTDERNFAGTPLGRLYAPDGANRTIASGIISVDGRTYYLVDTEAAAASDELDTINGGFAGAVIALGIVSAARIVTFTTAGNLNIGSPITLTSLSTLVLLRYDGAAWQPMGGMGGADILQVQVFS